MKENQEIQDKIDRFLLDQMDVEEKKNFQIDMDNNSDLKESVNIQKLIVEEIKERESFMSILDEAESSSKSIPDKSTQNKYKTFQINYSWAISIAAAIIGIAFIIWQPHKSSNQNIYNTYALAYARTNILESDNTIKTRGGAIYFENLSPSDNMIISEALLLYHDQNYRASKTIFEQVLVHKAKNDELMLYMAISQLFSNDIDNAINNLVDLTKLSNYLFKDQADYYLALAYIRSNQVSKARKLLKDIKEGNSEYANQAAEMLNEMRWF